MMEALKHYDGIKKNNSVLKETALLPRNSAPHTFTCTCWHPGCNSLGSRGASRHSKMAFTELSLKGPPPQPSFVVVNIWGGCQAARGTHRSPFFRKGCMERIRGHGHLFQIKLHPRLMLEVSEVQEQIKCKYGK